MTLEYRIKPQGETLAKYANSWGRVEAIMGPLGSGKTVQSCQKLFMAMCRQEPNDQGVRPSRWLAIRNTYPDLTSTTIKDWLELYQDLGRYVGGGLEPPTHHLEFGLPDGSTVKSQVIFLALDRPDAVKKLRGIQCTGFWLNEMKELPKPVVDMADLRHGRYPSMAAGGINPTWHGMIGDTNAPDEDHWYYELAEVVKPEGWNFYRQPGGVTAIGNDKFKPNEYAENIGNLPDGYYTKGMAGKSIDWIKVNLANEYGYVSSGKPVYPEYVDSVHCMQEEYKPDPALPIILGMDFGRTPACAFLQQLPIGRYVGFDEFCSDDMSASSFAPELKRYIDENYAGYEFARGGGDPAGGQGGQATDDTPFSILRDNQIDCVFPTETNDPLVRRSAIINPMKELAMDGRPRFMISPKCKMWRKGLQGGFCYKRIQIAGDERYHDKPDKNKYSHICEAGEYGMQISGEGRAGINVKGLQFNQPIKAKVSIAYGRR